MHVSSETQISVTLQHTDERNHRTAKTDYLPTALSKVYPELPMDFSSLSTKPHVNFEFQTNKRFFSKQRKGLLF